MAALVTSVPPVFAEDGKDENLLKQYVATVHYLWTVGLKKPKLVYDKIDKDTVDAFVGTWSGPFKNEDDKSAFMKMQVKADGTWKCETFRPDMEESRWYLSDGMFLLFEGASAKNGEFASALTANGDKLRLLYAEVEAGYIELTKVE